MQAVESAAASGVVEVASAIRDTIFNRQKVADDVAILAVEFTEQANVYQRRQSGYHLESERSAAGRSA